MDKDERDDSSRQPTTSVAHAISRRLYISHFLSTWNSRVFEFGAVLFIANIFPGTLLPSSVYALIRAAAAICFSPTIGRLIDCTSRLVVVRFSIVGQRAATIASCLGFLALVMNPLFLASFRIVILGALVLLACVEKLCSVMNLVAVERDWVVVIAENTDSDLQVLNPQLRRIDLFCKLIGPFAISLIDGFSTKVAILVTLGLNTISIPVEYGAIAKVHTMVPALQRPRSTPLNAGDGPGSSQIPHASQTFFGKLVTVLASIYKQLSFYFRHRSFLPSIALCFLYLTVLSFGGQMVTYLLSVGYNSTHIGVIRTVSVASEISATWVGPMAMDRIGPIRAGLWFIHWQIGCIAVAIGFFLGLRSPFGAAAGLVIGVILSRIGLWGFDLSVQTVIQDEVESESRGTFSSIEASFQNVFELWSLALTVGFSRPEQFRYPAMVSLVACCVAGAVYTEFVRRRRGHLLHMSSCVGGKERSGWRQSYRLDSFRYSRLQG